jgi:hypothetical protein
MQGAQESELYNRQGVVSYLKFDRVFQVNGLNANSTPRTAMSDAKALIKKLYPIGSFCPTNGNATARGYAATSTGSDDVVQVTLSYMYTDISPSATQWTIECTDWLETVDTDTELNVSDGNATLVNSKGEIVTGMGDEGDPGMPITQDGRRPILVKYYDNWWWPNEQPAQGFSGQLVPATDLDHPSHYEGLPKLSFAHVGVFRPRKRVIFTRTIYGNSDANKIEAAADQYEGCLNLKDFRGRKPTTWMCLSVGVIYNPYEGSNLARLEFAYRPPLEGWQPWVRYSSPLFHGTPPNVFRYTPSGKQGNGIRKSYQYTAVDFNDLIALLPGGVQGDPSQQNNGGGQNILTPPDPPLNFPG